MQLGEDEKLPLNMKVVLFAIGAGALSSILALSLVTGSGLALILAYLAPFPLLLVGLGNGAKPAAIAALSGIVFAILLGGPLSGSIFAVMNTFPCWLAIRLALTSRTIDGREEWFPIGNILVTFAGYGSALFVLALAFLVTPSDSLVQMVRDFLSAVMDTVAASLPVKQKEGFVDQMAHFFPAMVLVSWMLMTCINAILAQGVLTKSGKALRPKPTYGDLSLPDFASWAFIICAALTVLSDGDFEYVARNLTVVMALPFLALGLTVVHKLVRLTRFAGALLAAFYLLLLLSIWVALPVIGLGLIEQWIGLRNRIPSHAAIQEND
ncbi:conserved membrane hypothetical protein [Candidatus Terasakiella magnetica]|uniref:Membrane protein (DUF2232) n=1 Tax=Candidatus Terasakiella magnetica TaxID=1867952 RepID=A0A1C3RJX9_9PROT|nr:DUF2232 domain-containing protein [Candidatus Terasakiella magnetica]SCA57549.1 conserved membrane hypothetical protein [Candidatus Terasakiella magnetica]